MKRTQKEADEKSLDAQGEVEAEMEVERMVNEGLGGGLVTLNNGWVGETNQSQDVLATDEEESV